MDSSTESSVEHTRRLRGRGDSAMPQQRGSTPLDPGPPSSSSSLDRRARQRERRGAAPQSGSGPAGVPRDGCGAHDVSRRRVPAVSSPRGGGSARPGRRRPTCGRVPAGAPAPGRGCPRSRLLDVVSLATRVVEPFMADLVERLVADELWELFQRVVPPTEVIRPRGDGRRPSGSGCSRDRARSSLVPGSRSSAAGCGAGLKQRVEVRTEPEPGAMGVSRWRGRCCRASAGRGRCRRRR